MKGYWHIVAIAAICAILFIHYHHYLFIIVFIIWIGMLYALKRLRKLPLIVSLTFLIFFLLYFPETSTSPSEEEININPRPIYGEIISSIEKNDKKVEFVLKETITGERIVVIYFPNQKEEFSTHFLKYGASCVIQGKKEIPNGRRNPGEFDYQDFLKKQGIHVQITLSSIHQIHCDGFKSLDKIYSVRSNLLIDIQNELTPFTASWLNSLVLGDDSSLDEESVQLFRKWGLSHIIAISGTHVAILLTFMYFVLIKLSILTKEKAQWFVVIFMPIYAILAGGEPSIWRASMMAIIFILLLKIKAKYSVTDVLAIVFTLLIIRDPLLIYHVGFQFSFLVTFSILLSKRWLSVNKNPTMQALKISFVAQMIILPLQFIYFSFFQPLSILLNIIIIPYFSVFVIPFMYILLPLTLLPFPFVKFLDQAFTFIHQFVLQFIFLIDKVADTPWVIGTFSIGITCLYFILFLRMMMEMELNQSLKAFKLGILICLMLFFLVARPYLSPEGKVTMLDIGQGDAYIIELPYRKGVIMIDAGATFSFSDGTVSENTYKRIIKPYLYSQGIQKVDALILSHEDLDHVGSVPFIIEEMNVERIYIHPYYDIEEDKQWNPKKVKRVEGLDVLNIKGQPFYVLGPLKDSNNPNENSVVVYTKIGGLTWLFTGDIGIETEKYIINKYPDLKVDVLKVGHHGSNTSTGEELLKQINPKFAFISVGKNNRYGHPSPEVIQRMKDNDIVIFRTDEHGAVQYHFKGNSGTFSSFLPYYNHK
ncbi:DNA internalization-related competence protein ComEC/Rec2 [Oceanobacillus sp. Castelsardo]|uniref:DNA internalization-related competence protein ComEC/Rec2 n=1 Tax=Oceanobacillus sp. Castelsardo TaxID=1851204 RepID=UPI0008383510|nr:DNA internalization-related competence protein ComEC/Rec2 [Oceanobacillus sp. Castelsardo]